MPPIRNGTLVKTLGGTLCALYLIFAGWAANGLNRLATNHASMSTKVEMIESLLGEVRADVKSLLRENHESP